MRTAVFIAVSIAWTSFAAADPAVRFQVREAQVHEAQVRDVQVRGEGRAAPSVPCSCRYRGRDVDFGATICMRGRLATCEMVLNNTSWALTDRMCPLASSTRSFDAATRRPNRL